MKYGLLIALVTLSISASSRGKEFGSLKEVVKAAKNHQEPAYIPKLMEAFGRELRSQALDLSTSRHRQAFLLTMASIVRLHVHACGEAWGMRVPAIMGDTASTFADEAATNAAVDAAGRAAWRAAEKAAVNAAGSGAWDAAQKAAEDAAWDNYRDFVTTRVRISCWVAEWKMLNFIFESSEELIPKVYKATLSHLPKQESNSIFTSEAGWLAFRTKHFGELDDNDNALIFVEPWLTILDNVISKKAAIYEKAATSSFLPSNIAFLNFLKRRP